MFRKCVVAGLLLVICLSANAKALGSTTNPSIIHAPIQYPPSGISAREEGVVMIAAEVGIDGQTVDAKIAESSGYPDLDAAALQSISQWSFQPGLKDGKPEARWVRLPIAFQLQNQPPDIAKLPQSLLALTSTLALLLGGIIWTAGFVWSVVLAKHKSILWLSGMVALWAVTYPIFVATNWTAAKRNLMLVLLGIALTCLGLYLMPSHQLPI
jgi:TonB family protein